jgi:hypothetical protein
MSEPIGERAILDAHRQLHLSLAWFSRNVRLSSSRRKTPASLRLFQRTLFLTFDSIPGHLLCWPERNGYRSIGSRTMGLGSGPYEPSCGGDASSTALKQRAFKRNHSRPSCHSRARLSRETIILSIS